HAAAAKRDQPALRAAMRPLCTHANRPPHGVCLGVPKARAPEQRRPRPAPRRGLFISQSPADQRAVGNGGGGLACFRSTVEITGSCSGLFKKAKGQIHSMSSTNIAPP